MFRRGTFSLDEGLQDINASKFTPWFHVHHRAASVFFCQKDYRGHALRKDERWNLAIILRSKASMFLSAWSKKL